MKIKHICKYCKKDIKKGIVSKCGHLFHENCIKPYYKKLKEKAEDFYHNNIDKNSAKCKIVIKKGRISKILIDRQAPVKPYELEAPEENKNIGSDYDIDSELPRDNNCLGCNGGSDQPRYDQSQLTGDPETIDVEIDNA